MKPVYIERHLRQCVIAANKEYALARDALRASGETYGPNVDNLQALEEACRKAESALKTWLSNNHPERLDLDIDVATEDFVKL